MSNSSASPSGRGNSMPTLAQFYVQNIMSLLEDHPRGIERSKVVDAYQAKYHEEFPHAYFGFENPIRLIEDLEKGKVVHVKVFRHVPVGCKACYDATGEDFCGPKKFGDYIAMHYPAGVVGYKENIPLQPLPENLSPGFIFPVKVTEVTSPSKFWFQIWDNDLQWRLNDMTDDMQIFYNSNGPSIHKVSDYAVMIGQYCAAKFPPGQSNDFEWYRGIIISMPSMTEAIVSYVDYGTTARMPQSEIYFLDARFSKLPIQAHTACLTNIRPVGYGLWTKRIQLDSPERIVKPSWPRSIGPLLMDFIGYIPSFATVARIRKYDNFLSLCLTDTSGDDDIHVCDLLVAAHLAEFGEIDDFTRSSPPPPSQGQQNLLEQFESTCTISK